MTIEIVEGCLLKAFEKGEVNVMMQCVNCQGVMGSGVAKAIRDKYPFVYDLYKEFCGDLKPRQLLGEMQNIDLAHYDYVNDANWNGDTNPWPDKHIINIFGQEGYGYGKRQVNYGALGKAFTAASYGLTQASDQALQVYDIIGIPYKFASDRGGADWNIVLEMIDFHFKDFQVKIYKLEK